MKQENLYTVMCLGKNLMMLLNRYVEILSILVQLKDSKLCTSFRSYRLQSVKDTVLKTLKRYRYRYDLDDCK